MRALLDLFVPRHKSSGPKGRRMHMLADAWPSAIYAVGDVHGCLRQLRALEAGIIADAASLNGEKWLILLGDYVDRGPDSAAVIDHLLAAPPPGFRRICLAGNHEVMMQAFLESPNLSSQWLGLGGEETLLSYGIDIHSIADRNSSPSQLRQILDAHIPQNHMAFLQSLPLSCSVGHLVFVHAGIRPGVEMAQQDEADLLWMRYNDEDPGPRDRTVVHGHTPAAKPLVLSNRICLDTGAFATGILSAMRLHPADGRTLFQTAN